MDEQTVFVVDKSRLNNPEIKITDSDLSFSTINSLERFLEKTSSIEEFNDLLFSNKTVIEIKEILESNTRSILNLYYEIELSILDKGCIPIGSGKKIKLHKVVNSLCRIALCLPGFDIITLPESFADEYTSMLNKVNSGISAITERIKKINNNPENKKVIESLNKNLLMLTMLKKHYIDSLGLEEV